MVEGWWTPERLWGHPERDARHHPSVREGRYHEFPADDVLDWAIMTEGGVTVEDAWTAPPAP